MQAWITHQPYLYIPTSKLGKRSEFGLGLDALQVIKSRSAFAIAKFGTACAVSASPSIIADRVFGQRLRPPPMERCTTPPTWWLSAASDVQTTRNHRAVVQRTNLGGNVPTFLG